MEDTNISLSGAMTRLASKAIVQQPTDTQVLAWMFAESHEIFQTVNDTYKCRHWPKGRISKITKAFKTKREAVVEAMITMSLGYPNNDG